MHRARRRNISSVASSSSGTTILRGKRHESVENARAQAIRKVAIAITYRQTKPRNSDVDFIRYDRSSR